MTKQTMTIEKVKENGKAEKSVPKQCMEEIQETLDKYKCQIICQPQMMYGQTVYVPSIIESK